MAEPLGGSEIAAGCMWDTDSPTVGCSKCDWRGGVGGRTFVTDTSCFSLDAESDEAFNESVDLTKLSIEQLYECGKFNLNARYELVFRGISAVEVDDFYDQFDDGDAASMPLIPVNVMIAYYNSHTELIEQVCYFDAKGRFHNFTYLRPGMDDWDAASGSMSQFHETVFSTKKEGVSGWIIKFPEVVNDYEFSTPDHFGSPVIQAMIANRRISEEQLSEGAIKLDTTVYWPYWFEPAFYIS